MAHAADGCVAGVLSDSNGDGWSDAVVGDPSATVAGQVEAGRIVVLYGDGDGLVGEGARDVLWQGRAEVSDLPQAGDRFASALAVADLDCDGYTDVVAGTPGQDVAGQADAGMVQVLWGGAAGLAATRPAGTYTTESFGRDAAAGDQFGSPSMLWRTSDRAARRARTPSPLPSGSRALMSPVRATPARSRCRPLSTVARPTNGSPRRRPTSRDRPKPVTVSERPSPATTFPATATRSTAPSVRRARTSAPGRMQAESPSSRTSTSMTSSSASLSTRTPPASPERPRRATTTGAPSTPYWSDSPPGSRSGRREKRSARTGTRAWFSCSGRTPATWIPAQPSPRTPSQ